MVGNTMMKLQDGIKKKTKKIAHASRANWVRVRHVFPNHFRKIAPFPTWIKVNITRTIH